MRLCSWPAGRRSRLLRGYDEPGTVEEFTTAPTTDQLIVLVTDGRYPIEVRHHGRWRTAQYEVGSLGMTAPGEEATLRWRNGFPTSTLHLHLPGQTIRSAAEALWNRDPQKVAMPNALKYEDPTILQNMLALREAALAGIPDLHAEGAADFLAVHLPPSTIAFNSSAATDISAKQGGRPMAEWEVESSMRRLCAPISVVPAD